MTKEKRALFDSNGNGTNNFYYKGDEVPKGQYPMVVMVCIQNDEGEFLMQRRELHKGGDWGVTGGHVDFGESPEEALYREVEEELGVRLTVKPVLFSFGCDGKDCFGMYYAKQNFDLSQFKIQEKELSEVRWFSTYELDQMVKTGELNEDQISCFKKCMKFLNSKISKK
jgi:8-oxo-dGTP diphosphatase